MYCFWLPIPSRYTHNYDENQDVIGGLQKIAFKCIQGDQKKCQEEDSVYVALWRTTGNSVDEEG